MADIWKIAKSGFLPFFGIFFNIGKGKRTAKNRSAWVAVIAAAILLMLMFSCFVYEYGMMISLAQLGLENVLLPVIMVAASVSGFIGSVFRAGNALFSFREYELLLSLPVPKWKISAARMLLLYLFDLVFVVVLMVPAGIIHSMFAAPPLWFHPVYYATIFIVPLLPLVLSAVVGTLLMAFSRSFKHKHIATTVFSIIAVVAIMGLSFRSDKLLIGFGSIGQQVMASMVQYYPPAYLYSAGIIDGNWLFMALYVLLSVGAALLASLLAAKNMTKLREAFAAPGLVAAYRRREERASSPLIALWKKEARRFFASTTLMMNGGIGVILMVAGAVALLFVDPVALLASMGMPPELSIDMLYGYLPAVLCAFVALTFPAACSVSLEGKSISLLKSFPVSASTIIWAKAGMSLMLTVPAVIISGIIAIFALNIPMAIIPYLFALPLIVAVISALLGVMVNLALPSFDWSSEVTVIKQSAASLLAMLIAFALCAPLFAAAGMTSGSAQGLAYAVAGALAALGVCLVLMKTWAEKRLRSL